LREIIRKHPILTVAIAAAGVVVVISAFFLATPLQPSASLVVEITNGTPTRRTVHARFDGREKQKPIEIPPGWMMTIGLTNGQDPDQFRHRPVEIWSFDEQGVRTTIWSGSSDELMDSPRKFTIVP